MTDADAERRFTGEPQVVVERRRGTLSTGLDRGRSFGRRVDLRSYALKRTASVAG